MKVERCEKLDIIDLIIDTLTQHEKALDLIVKRLEYITPRLEKEINR